MDVALMVEEAGGVVIGPFHRSAEALASLEKNRPDLAIIDFNLGNHTSERLAEVLNERGIPLIFLTGHSDKSLEQLAPKQRIFEKPILPEAIAVIMDLI